MIRLRNIVVVAVLVFMMPLSSCFVGQKYQRPDLKTKNLFRTDRLTDSSLLVMDSASIAEVSWEHLFADPLLQGYINTALKNNIDIRIALQSIKSAAAYVKQSKASFYPTINAGLNYNGSHPSQNGLQQGQGNWFNQYDLEANFSWEADIWGKIKSQKLAARAQYLKTIEAHKAVKTRLVANIATTYYQLAALDKKRAIAHESIATRDSSLSTTKILKKAGQLTAVAVEQAQAQVYAAQLILLQLEERERVLENSFCLLLNEPPHSIMRNGLSVEKIKTPLKTGVPADLLANRPDVRQAEFNLINALELTNVAKSNFYPSLTITASGGLQSIDIKKWLSLNSIFANIAGSLLEPIVNHRQIKTAYEVAQYQQKQALLNYQAVLLAAGNDVSNALYNYQTQTKTIALQQKQYQSLRKAVNASRLLLNNGLANYLEVLTAQQSALSAQLNLVDAKVEKLVSIVQLYQALGGGWR